MENYAWYCDDAQLYQYGRPDPGGDSSATTYWRVIDNDATSAEGPTKVNPFTAPGFPGTCQVPQITRGGLEDSWQHGNDLYGVYHDLLHLIPDKPSEADLADPKAPFHQQVRFRITNNPITSQVAGMILNGMFGITSPYPLQIQPKPIDSLEPAYNCPKASSAYQYYGPRSSYLPSPPPGAAPASRRRWLQHLTSISALFNRLDHVSDVDREDRSWHQSLDHYFDSLSSRLCHSMPLPCNATLPTGQQCITQEEAEEVFRLGMWEYSHIYRDAPESLSASAASFGVWLAELAQHLRDRATGRTELVYMHNVAHDGSISRLLSALQVDVMVWPGLGSEIVFELYKSREKEENGHNPDGDGLANGMAHKVAEGNTSIHYEEHSAGSASTSSTAAARAAAQDTSTSDYHIRILWGGHVFKSSDPALGVVDMLPLTQFLAYIDGLVGRRAVNVKEMCGL